MTERDIELTRTIQQSVLASRAARSTRVRLTAGALDLAVLASAVGILIIR